MVTGAIVTLAAAGVPLVEAAQAAAPLATTQAPGFYRYKAGDLQITAINDGFFARPIEGFIRNADLAAVQKLLEEQALPTNAVTIPFTTLVVNDGRRLTLLDTGNGNSGAPTSGRWMDNFRAAGFTPEQVDTIVISHFHGDHINGLRLKEGNAVFPNAEIHVPAPEWAFWMSDERMNAAPDAMKGAFANVRRVFAPIAANVKRYNPGAEVVTGVTSIAAHGHTPGHCAFAIGGKLLAMSDATNHPALFVRQPGWQAIFDMDGGAAEVSRRRLLDMAIANRMQVAFYHAPFPATGTIQKDGNGYRLVPVSWSSAI
jgi:glyoxylase-like metal-dependent hydrolase (beta-lactamase superfamily II)